MVQPPFHPDDVPNLAGPPEAFDPKRWSVPGLQNHLALEIVDHLAAEDIQFVFRGGTALHSKLATRARYSVDVDLDSVNPAEIHASLKSFAARFPRSVHLEEPPGVLKIQGVKHILTFPLTQDGPDPPKQVLVEVARWDELSPAESMALTADGLTWPHRAQGPSLSAFMGQKLSTIGPTTVGIEIGPNATHTRMNQSVAKQLFDLRELGRQPLDPREVADVYSREVHAVSARRRRTVAIADAAADGGRLLSELRAPRAMGQSTPPGHALWSGYRDTRRLVQDASWNETAFRVTGGVVVRVLNNLTANPGPDWSTMTRPLSVGSVPANQSRLLDQAIQRRDPWVPPHYFGGTLPVAWAWSPREYW